MPTEKEYRALAAQAESDLSTATNDRDRLQLKRARAAYLRLATSGAEAIERAASPKKERIIAEKPKALVIGRTPSSRFL
jgi:hypothetical protein